MEKSTNFKFNLPSSTADEPADVNLISDNFEIIDDVLKQTDDSFDASSNNPQSGTALSSILGSTYYERLLSFEIGQVMDISNGYVASATDCALKPRQYSIFIPCTVTKGTQTAKAEIYVYQYGATTPFTTSKVDIVPGGIKAIINPSSAMNGIEIGIMNTISEIESLSNFGITKINDFTSKVPETRKVMGLELTKDITADYVRNSLQNTVVNPSAESITLKDGDRVIYTSKSALSISFAEISMYYQSEIYFTSGATATAFSYPDNVYFTGDSCANGVFIPTTNVRYAIIFYYDSGISKMQAVVRGVPIG